ncbi:MAG: hypothetical protein JO023_09920, partial [Chloroflexi bacterium]|nr:hypothetical protein [Chloroflexota bacterium]
ELLYFLTLIDVMTALGIAWGVLYGALENHFATRLPDWQQGLLFAVLPLTMSLLAVVPVIVSSGFGSATRWLSAAAAEALLWAIYGVLLGLAYPIFNARPRSTEDPAAGTPAGTDG